MPIDASGPLLPLFPRHCEERGDAAVQGTNAVLAAPGLPRRKGGSQ